uniref:Uncharacterized protein n=1 Tax=Ditylenchus dipsaci TaxID=166011 RepID=A0A915CW38_9BILA
MSKQTKPLSWCWSYFTCKEEKSKFVGYYRFCNPNCEALKPGRYTGSPTRMEEHLKICIKVGAEASKEINRLLKRPAARRSRSSSPKELKLSEAAKVSPQESSGTIKHYFETTSKDEQ